MPLGSIVLLALALRLLVALLMLVLTGSATSFHSLDTGSYLEPAYGLASTGRFEVSGEPEIVRTPAYPLLLVPGVLLGAPELLAVLLQIALSCFTVYLIYKTALLLFESHRPASWAALLYALEPLSILYAARILTETLFTAALALFLYLIVRWMKGGTLAHLVGASLACALTAYVRPISLYLPAVIAVVLLGWVLLQRRGMKKALQVGLFLAVAVGTLGAWQVRNATVADYNGFSAIADINLYFYQGASVLAAQRGVPYYAVQEEMGYNDPEKYLSLHPEQRAWSAGDRYEYMGREGRKLLLGGLPGYLKTHAAGMVKTLVNPGGVEYLKSFGLHPAEGGEFAEAVEGGPGAALAYLVQRNAPLLATNLFFGLLLGATLLLSALALVSRRFWSTWALLPVLSTGFYLLVMSGGPQSLSRFRHPIMPVLCLLAGYGLYVIMEKVESRRRLRIERRGLPVGEGRA